MTNQARQAAARQQQRTQLPLLASARTMTKRPSAGKPCASRKHGLYTGACHSTKLFSLKENFGTGRPCLRPPGTPRPVVTMVKSAYGMPQTKGCGQKVGARRRTVPGHGACSKDLKHCTKPVSPVANLGWTEPRRMMAFASIRRH